MENHENSSLEHGKDGKQFFPDRVLDIGQIGDRAISLRLNTRDEKPEPYATLSYCWGNTTHLKLGTTNFERLKIGINVNGFPKTFRNAVAIVRELGLRYLWIDSLCIIQDSKEDWREQSALMGSIYRHSRVNIAASASKNSEGGLFFNRDPLLVLPMQVHTRFPFTDKTQPVRWYDIVDQKPYYVEIERAPLNARGWVMQERLLSPRVLHCTDQQLFWECEKLLANESFPEGIQTVLDRKPGEFNQLLRGYLPRWGSTVNQKEPYIEWFKLVQQYSAYHITRDEDILIGFSGLTKLWKTVIPDEYLAGLWRRWLPFGLLWHHEARIPSNLAGEQCPTWRAPSWSWASYKGAVRWSGCVVPIYIFREVATIRATLIRVLDASITLASEDPTGEILLGSLSIKGLLMTGLVGLNGKWPEEFQDVVAYEVDTFDFICQYGPSSRCIVLNTEHRTFQGVCYFESNSKRKEIDKYGYFVLTCLPVILFRQHSEEDGSSSIAIGLEGIMLEKARDAGYVNGEYVRIGHFLVVSGLNNVILAQYLFQKSSLCTIPQIANYLRLGELEDIVIV